MVLAKLEDNQLLFLPVSLCRLYSLSSLKVSQSPSRLVLTSIGEIRHFNFAFLQVVGPLPTLCGQLPAPARSYLAIRNSRLPNHALFVTWLGGLLLGSMSTYVFRGIIP